MVALDLTKVNPPAVAGVRAGRESTFVLPRPLLSDTLLTFPVLVVPADLFGLSPLNLVFWFSCSCFRNALYACI